MKDCAVITVPSNPRYLSVIRSVTTRMGELSGMSAPLIDDVKLAVDEACANVIKHAYKGDTSKKIVVRFHIRRKAFEVVIEDSGLKSQPELIQGRSLDDVRPGGLGVHFIKKVFDVFAFDEKKKRGNRLRLIKHVSRKE